MESFGLEERDLQDGYREIAVRGELDLAVADRLAHAIDAVADDCAGVVIGLAGCELIDSTAIAVIVRAHQRFAEAGRRLVVCCPKDQPERVLEITGLRETGMVFDSVEEAVKGG